MLDESGDTFPLLGDLKAIAKGDTMRMFFIVQSFLIILVMFFFSFRLEGNVISITNPFVVPYV